MFIPAPTRRNAKQEEGCPSEPARRGRGQPGPVRADQEIQVARVDRSIRIIGHGLAVQFEQPAKAASPAEWQHDRRRHCKHRRETDQEVFEHRAAFLRRLPDLAVLQEQRYQAQRTEHQRLRFHQHCQHIAGQGKSPVFAHSENQRKRQEEHHHAVRLPPARAGQEQQRIEQEERRHREGERSRYSPALSTPFFITRCQSTVNDKGHAQISQDRRDLDHELGRSGRKPLSQQADNPEHQDVSRRIVADIHAPADFRIQIQPVEAGRPIDGNLGRPRAEIAHVHVIAVHQHRQQNAHEQSEGKQCQNQQFSRFQRLFPIGAAQGVPRHPAIHEQGKQHQGRVADCARFGIRIFVR